MADGTPFDKTGPGPQARRPTLLTYSLLLAVFILLANLGIVLFVEAAWVKAILFQLPYPLWGLLAVLALGYAAKRSALHSRPLGLAWGLLAIARLLLVIGETIVVILTIELGTTPFPSLADGFFLAFYPLFLSGVLLLPAHRLQWLDWLKIGLEMSIVLCASLLLLWLYWLGPLAETVRDERRFVQALALAHPVGNLVLLWALLMLLYRQRAGPRPPALFLLALGMGLQIGMACLYGRQAVLATSASRDWLGVGWLVTNLIFGIAGMWQATRGQAANTSADALTAAAPSRLNTWLTYLPYGCAIAAYLMLIGHQQGEPQSLAAWIVGIIISLVLMRQMLTLRENSLLLAQGRQQAIALQQTNVTLHGQIAVRQQTEDELRAQTSRLTTLLENLPGGILVQDSTDHIAHINQAFCDMFGIATSPTDLLGANSATLTATVMANFTDSAGYRRRLDAIIHHRQPINAEELTLADGRTFERDYAPIFVDTDYRGHLWHYRDITARKQVEAAMRHSEERYRLLFDHNPQPMWVLDLETLAFLDVNAAAIHHYGYSRQEFLTMTAKEIRPVAEVPRFLDYLAHITPAHQAAGIWRHQKKDGTRIDVEITAHRLRIDGRPAQLVLVYDVTARRALEEQLRQAQKMETIGQLAGGIAHDFNNLLTGITGYSELALRRLPPADPVRHDLEQIKKAGDRATALTRQLLAFSRKQILQPQRLNLNTIVTEMEKMLRPLIGEHIQLRTLLGTALGSVQADPGQLEQVIMNLVLNARDAMPHGGQLTIETANVDLNAAYTRQHMAVNTGPHVMLAISDTGMGMDEQTQKHIFEPFFTTKAIGQGTGLGLATVYGIVKQSGGHIWVYSEVGLGTVFKVYLPCLAESASQHPPSREQAVVRSGTETILLAEDEEMVRELACAALTMHGYQVLVASNGSGALLLGERHPAPIHLLLTDVIMPELNGPALVQHLAPLRPTLKVLYMSGYTDNAIIHQGVLAAETNFIQKPFTPATLAAKVRAVLDE